MDEKEIQNRVLREQYSVLKKRGTPDSDPRVKAILRVMQLQKMGQPKEGVDFPPQIKFKARRKQHGVS